MTQYYSREYPLMEELIDEILYDLGSTESRSVQDFLHTTGVSELLLAKAESELELANLDEGELETLCCGDEDEILDIVYEKHLETVQQIINQII